MRTNLMFFGVHMVAFERNAHLLLCLQGNAAIDFEELGSPIVLVTAACSHCDTVESDAYYGKNTLRQTV